MLSFVYGMLVDSEELILRRPGHEALWCHRRALFTALLQLVRDLCSCGTTDGSNNGEGDGAGSRWSQLASTVNSAQSSSIASECCQSWDLHCSSSEAKGGSSDGTCDTVAAAKGRCKQLSLAMTSYQPSSLTGGTPDAQLVQWLVDTLSDEASLCRRCIDQSDLQWGEGRVQRVMATRYCAFVMDTVSVV